MMNRLKFARPPYVLMVTALVLAVLVFAMPVSARDGAQLRILLTNDDGVEAPGIKAMRARLIEAGHNVLTVAPSGNRSGSSGSITSRGAVAATKLADKIYSVNGTPADCTRIGLQLIADGPIDLVVSGVNFGQNIGPTIRMSGTVGAARAAQASGIPAIAASQAIDPANIEGTAAYLDDAAVAVVGVLSSLLIDGGTLPKGMLLNINHPLRKASDLEGWRMTKPAASFGGGLDYAWNADQSAIDVTFRFGGGQGFEADSDAQALVDGALSITSLMADFALDDGLASRLTAVSETP